MTRDGSGDGDVVGVFVGGIVLGHEVGQGLANALGILVNGGFVVVVLFCIGDHALDVALDGAEGGVFMAFELVLRSCVRWCDWRVWCREIRTWTVWIAMGSLMVR